MSDKIYEPLSKADCNPLRYACFKPELRNHIAAIEKHPDVCKHINELYDLIAYQMDKLFHKEHELIANRHKEAWKRYDKPMEEYDWDNRRYFSPEELEARKC